MIHLFWNVCINEQLKPYSIFFLWNNKGRFEAFTSVAAHWTVFIPGADR